MLKGLGSLGTLFKGAQELRSQMDRMQEELRQLRVEGSAGGGLVTIEMNGRQDVLRCRIDPQWFASGDREMLEDLIAAAVHQALERSRSLAAEHMSKLVGGLQVPGLTEAIQQFTPPAAAP